MEDTFRLPNPDHSSTVEVEVYFDEISEIGCKYLDLAGMIIFGVHFDRAQVVEMLGHQVVRGIEVSETDVHFGDENSAAASDEKARLRASYQRAAR